MEETASLNRVEIKTGTIYLKTMKAFQQGKKIVVHKGGTGSGKTFDIMLFLFSVAMNNSGLVITVVSESRPHLDIGSIRILESVCKPIGLWGPGQWNMTTARWVSPKGSIIEFFSADRIDKALGARRDWLYGNEINSLKESVWDELARRSENVIADFNPTSQFWLEKWADNYDDVAIISSNYMDNPFLPDTEAGRIRKRATKDANFKRIHIDCEYGVTEGIIYTNWQQIARMPEGEKIYGLDFGFTNDPTALIATMETEEAIYLDELIYRTGLLNTHIISLFGQLGLRPRVDEIIADSAEPKSIQEIHNAGYVIKPAIKGPDSVRAGISVLQSKPMYVTQRSVNLIKELRNYSWALDKDNNPTNKPVYLFNHALDAARYALNPKYRFKFSIK